MVTNILNNEAVYPKPCKRNFAHKIWLHYFFFPHLKKKTCDSWDTVAIVSRCFGKGKVS